MNQVSTRDTALTHLLNDFLESGRCPKHTMNFYQLDGYLRALAVSPGQPDVDWKGLVFNDGQPDYQHQQEALMVAGALEQLLAFHYTEVALKLCNLPCSAVYASLPEERVDLEQWARGFLQGYIVREEVWSRAIPSLTNGSSDHILGENEFIDELDAILYIVSTVADAKYAIEKGTDLNDLDAIFVSLPDAIVSAGNLKLLLEQATHSSAPLISN